MIVHTIQTATREYISHQKFMRKESNLYPDSCRQLLGCLLHQHHLFAKEPRVNIGNAANRMRKWRTFGLCIAATLAIGRHAAFAQISITTSLPYTQSFDSIGSTASATLPTDFRVDATATSASSDVR